MQLPNKSNASVSTDKIVDYLLSETHAVGKSKAKFFRSFGFNEKNISAFEQGLLNIAQTESVAESTETVFGIKYVIDGKLATPNGAIIQLRTVWIIEIDSVTPKLVTAYPLN
jgi:hypothetical protein